MTNNEAELRERVNKLLDFFTEPGQGEKYLKDLENDLMSLISDHTRKARLNELEACLAQVPMPSLSYEQVEGRIAALKQPTGGDDGI